MNASELRQEIKFQTPTTSSDGSGGRTASVWNTVYTARAKITPTGGSLSLENGQTRGVKTFDIVIRFAKDFTITHEHRILFGTRILTPNVTINPDVMEHWIGFTATEYTA